MIWRGSSQKSAGISGKRRTCLRSSRRNWSFGDFYQHSCVRFSRYLLERFSPLVRPRRIEERASEDLVLARVSRSRARFSVLLSSSPLQMHSPRGPICALSSSLIEYSLLYLRMPVEIYRRSRCSFRFNLLRPALTSSALSFPVFVLHV